VSYDVTKPLNHIVGVSSMSTHIVDYVAQRFGKEAAAFFSIDELRSTAEIGDEKLRTAVEDQILLMGKDWVLEYLAIETCGLNIVIEPSLLIRMINVKSFINLLAIQRRKNS
jgi:hypothetical protein